MGGITISILRTAARTLRRNRLYTTINVLGLAVALVVAIIVGMLIRADLQWDRFHEKGARIYQVYMPGPTKWQPNPPYYLEYFELTPNALGRELTASIPGVRGSVRAFGMMGSLRRGGTVLTEWGQHADPGFFELFSFPLVRGDPGSVLDDPRSIVISARLAAKLFGDEDPMGQTVLLRRQGGGANHVVTGVAADAPYASTLQFDWVIPFVHLESLWERTAPWDLAGMTFLEIDDESAAAAVESWDLSQHVPDRELVLIRLLDLRLHPQVGESGTGVFVAYGSVAALIVLVAALNFANLGMSMSLVRAQEVGVRKAIGAGRSQVAAQFIGESLLMSYLAVLLAIPLTQAVLPGLNRLFTFPGDFDLRLDLEPSAGIAVLLFGLGTVVGLAAGAYPAAVQSRMGAAQVLRERPSLGGHGFGRVLVVVQFVVSVAFLATALLVNRQAAFWRDGVDLGYDEAQLVAIPTLARHGSDSDIHPSHRLVEILRRELSGVGDVAAVTGVDDFPGGRTRLRLGDADVDIDQFIVEPQFVRTFGLQLIDGQDLPEDLLAAESVALVTRSLAQGLDGPAVGTVLEFGNRPRVVGVVEDFAGDRPSDPMRPAVIVVHPGRAIEEIVVRLQPGAGAATVEAIRQAWDRTAPDVPFTYEHLSHRRARYADPGTGTILGWLAGFLAVISALGVFGLVSFATVRRTREVGVRKALGATTTHVVWLFGSQFTRLVTLGAVLAWPLAWWMSELMLGGEANRIEFDVLSYAGAGAFALALTWLVSAYHMWRVTQLNPAHCLRVE